MSRSFAFTLADVFTTRRFSGNQLATFTDARGISPFEMQTIAREINFSETTFVLPPEIPGAIKRLRIFTPARELPMAGHPVVGATFVLASRGEIPMATSLTLVNLQLEIGLVAVSIESENGAPRCVWMAHRKPEFGAIRADRDRVAKAVGVEESDFTEHLPLKVVSSGVPFLFVPLKSVAALERCRSEKQPQLDLWSGDEPMGLYMFAKEESPCTYRVRCFAHAAGIAEDPATGGAAGPLAGYLVQYGLLPHEPEIRLMVHQGAEIGRPSEIRVEILRKESHIPSIRIGGSVVLCAEGAMRLD
jgi:trans-2,3-dihydro-3-hydroxyanthranilate isomerase